MEREAAILRACSSSSSDFGSTAIHTGSGFDLAGSGCTTRPKLLLLARLYNSPLRYGFLACGSLTSLTRRRELLRRGRGFCFAHQQLLRAHLLRRLPQALQIVIFA